MHRLNSAKISIGFSCSTFHGVDQNCLTANFCRNSFARHKMNSKHRLTVPTGKKFKDTFQITFAVMEGRMGFFFKWFASLNHAAPVPSFRGSLDLLQFKFCLFRMSRTRLTAKPNDWVLWKLINRREKSGRNLFESLDQRAAFFNQNFKNISLFRCFRLIASHHFKMAIWSV